VRLRRDAIRMYTVPVPFLSLTDLKITADAEQRISRAVLYCAQLNCVRLNE
jgi:hypothetical protein